MEILRFQHFQLKISTPVFLKRFSFFYEIAPKGEEHKWNFSSEMAKYANEHFRNYIPDKDVEEVLPENSKLSNRFKTFNGQVIL